MIYSRFKQDSDSRDEEDKARGDRRGMKRERSKRTLSVGLVLNPGVNY